MHLRMCLGCACALVWSAVVLAVVVLLTSIFAWYQESSSAAIMEGFKKFLVRAVWLAQRACACWLDWHEWRITVAFNSPRHPCVASLLPLFFFFFFSFSQPTVVSCTRDGRSLQVKAETLVPGDLIKVGMGGKLPADIRIVEASADLLANTSSLTGESAPQERGVEAGHAVVIEAKNLALFGTQIIPG